jgi:large subunit ribosomal protein L24
MRYSPPKRPKKVKTMPKGAGFMKNDEIYVICGKLPNGERHSKVVSVLTQKNRITVENLNLVDRRIRPRADDGGGVKNFEIKHLSIHASNVMLFCPHCQKPTRKLVVRHQITRGNKTVEIKVRKCRRCNEILDQNKILREERNFFSDK